MGSIIRVHFLAEVLVAFIVSSPVRRFLVSTYSIYAQSNSESIGWSGKWLEFFLGPILGP